MNNLKPFDVNKITVIYSFFMVKIKGSLKAYCKSKVRSKFRKKSLICYNFSTPAVTRIYNCKWMNEQMAKKVKSKIISGKQHLKSNLFIERSLLQLKENLIFIVSISLKGQCDTLKIFRTTILSWSGYVFN